MLTVSNILEFRNRNSGMKVNGFLNLRSQWCAAAGFREPIISFSLSVTSSCWSLKMSNTTKIVRLSPTKPQSDGC